MQNMQFTDKKYMDKINYHKHHQVSASGRRSPRLIRNRSTCPAISLLPDSKFISRDNASKSTTSKLKSSSCRVGKEKLNPIKTQKRVPVLLQYHDDSEKFLPHVQSKIEVVPRKARSASTSPSAWALSPGRLPPSLPAMTSPVQVPKSPIVIGKLKRELCSKSSKGVSGVLKYFRQKKVSPSQQEEYHQFRIMHNGLLQWRFANARAQIATAAAKRNAEKKLFNVWARITILRQLVAEHRIKMQRLKHEIKLYQIVGSQMCLLKEWGRLENKNFEAVGRLARKLSAISICLPLVQGAKADAIPIHDTMCMAMGIMESIEGTITPIQSQVEKTCYLLTELSIVFKEQTDNMNNQEKLLHQIASLEAAERSLKVHSLQIQT